MVIDPDDDVSPADRKLEQAARLQRSGMQRKAVSLYAEAERLLRAEGRDDEADALHDETDALADSILTSEQDYGKGPFHY